MAESLNEINFNGFLPANDPLQELPTEFSLWDDLGYNLPKLLLTDTFRATLSELPIIETAQLKTSAELERAMLLLSFLGHAYVWGSHTPALNIPAGIAKPWYEISQKLQRPPVLSYASYALHNWRRKDTRRPIELGNIALLQNFLGGLDEEWFVLIHIDIENHAAVALNSLLPTQLAAKHQNFDLILKNLETIQQSLEKMCASLDRMPENCDPYIYYNRVRPYIHGWKNNPALPVGIIYEGVTAYEHQPQQFRGETGAQSSIIPAFDAFLGIDHYPDPLRIYLMEMRQYMPKAHRQFIETIEQSAAIRDFVLLHYQSVPNLRDLYNSCVSLIARFRTTHLHYAAQYIQKQGQTSFANSTQTGTGGTPFMQYLKKHKDESLRFLI